MTVPPLTLVLGGARSGKSRYAESLITALPPPWIYVATAQPRDAEMTERIAEHRARRGGGWQTIEAPHDLAARLAACRLAATVLVDCLTLWLTNRMLAGPTSTRDRISRPRWRGTVAAVVLVSNEVGSGVVPDNALARRFADLQGRLNQRIAARADRVVLVVAGLPLT